MDPRFATIVLQAQECEWNNPHVTILFMGNAAKFSSEKRERIIYILQKHFKGLEILTEATGRGAWPVGKDKTAFPILGDEVERIHKRLVNMLRHLGAGNESVFLYTPHITVPNTADIPVTFFLGPMELWWAGEKIVIE